MLVFRRLYFRGVLCMRLCVKNILECCVRISMKSLKKLNVKPGAHYPFERSVRAGRSSGPLERPARTGSAHRA